MPIITLTTDLGDRDPYVGIVKGRLISRIPNAQIIDISHQVHPYNSAEAAWIVRETYLNYPAETIHVVSVDTQYDKNPQHLVLRHRDQWFVGPDNGLFALSFEPENPARIYKLSYFPTTFPLSDLYVDAVKKLVDKKPESLEAEEIKSLRVSMNWQPQISEAKISGNVIYIDRFQNAITNIRKEIFEKTRNGRIIRVAFRGYNDMNHISRDYSDVPAGEKLCLFNSSGYLEIAINKGNAAGLLNIRMRDTIQIDFL